jgi:hypothetical protein
MTNLGINALQSLGGKAWTWKYGTKNRYLRLVRFECYVLEVPHPFAGRIKTALITRYKNVSLRQEVLLEPASERLTLSEEKIRVT